MNKVQILVDAGGYFPFDLVSKESVSGGRRFNSRELAIQWVEDRFPCEIVC